MMTVREIEGERKREDFQKGTNMKNNVAENF